jgi:NADH-quinone oxidoreductase subunit N
MIPMIPAPLDPAIVLALGALGALLLGSFTRQAWVAFLFASQILLAVGALLILSPATGAVVFEGGPALLAFSPFSHVVALFIVGLSLLVLPLLWHGFGPERRRPELAVLLLLATTGAVLLPAANHMLAFYVALELLSFPLYILCAWNRDDAKSSEAGLKYFVLGSLASGLMLFGISLLYAATGALDFATLTTLAQPTPLFLVGTVLVLVGVVFKLSLVPFHFYTPDVYEGAPTPITALLAALPKVAMAALLIRLLVGPLHGPAALLAGQGLAVLAAASMVLGSTLAIVQGNLKRLFAYSTIANMGFALVPVAALAGLPYDATHLPLIAATSSGALFYVVVYGLTSIGLFAALMMGHFTQVSDLQGLAKRNPALATAMGVLLFSLAGIPPLAGFMGKLLAFTPAVQAGWGLLVLVGVVFSVVASAYSLWLVKVMVFDEASGTKNQEPEEGHGLGWLVGLCAILVLLLGLFPAPLHTLLLAAGTAIY